MRGSSVPRRSAPWLPRGRASTEGARSSRRPLTPPLPHRPREPGARSGPRGLVLGRGAGRGPRDPAAAAAAAAAAADKAEDEDDDEDEEEEEEEE